MTNPGMFSGMGNAKRQHDANYIKPGRYYMRVDSCAQFVTANRANSFKAVLTVLHHIDSREGRANRIGEVVSWLAQDIPYPDSFLPKVKGFVACCTGCTDEQITEAEMRAITDEKENALAGYIIEVEVREVPKKTQPAGLPAGTPPVMTTKTVFRRCVMADELELVMDPTWKAKLYPKGIPKS